MIKGGFLIVSYNIGIIELVVVICVVCVMVDIDGKMNKMIYFRF